MRKTKRDTDVEKKNNTSLFSLGKKENKNLKPIRDLLTFPLIEVQRKGKKEKKLSCGETFSHFNVENISYITWSEMREDTIF